MTIYGFFLLFLQGNQVKVKIFLHDITYFQPGA